MYSLVVGLLQPFMLVFLCLVAAVMAVWRKPESRRRLWFLAAAMLAMTIICTPAVAFLALATLEWQVPPPERSIPDRADVIVVLAGGVRVYDDEGKWLEPTSDTMFRCLHAAKVYDGVGPCPVLVSGGKVDPQRPGPTLAGVMRELLVELGVDPADVILEEESTTTYENAQFSGRLLVERDLGRIVLVTDAMHMPRAAACFRRQGIQVTPSPCSYRAARFEWSIRSFLPSAFAPLGLQEAFHEWLGTAWYRLRGRV